MMHSTDYFNRIFATCPMSLLSIYRVAYQTKRSLVPFREPTCTTNREGLSGSVQIESVPKLLQTFVFVTSAVASGINQSNGGLSESAGLVLANCSSGGRLFNRHVVISFVELIG